ncbi:electron transport complex subunit RsxG [Tolumonas osonensis]|uniref:Ion-translocating oxidoreductase complex subunit G n=1 Tax=Tolumonas osonensis TaxID=675874 RepID=A0A841GQ35_9GAMM|nr:electron transport complex subunit RsxG [Tolumonas osonensis]MBB6055673.1 electron transport complex protein RnfG [Tolumonas osonensis]
MLQSMRKNGLRLSFFALVCTGAIVFTDYKTHNTIAAQQQLQLRQLLVSMLPAESYDNDLSKECHSLTSDYLGNQKAHPVYIALKNGKITGYVIESVAPDGYSGSIRLLTGVSPDAVIQRTEVLEHHETPGLGDKIERRKSDWIDSFNHQQLTAENSTLWAVKKDGGQFDSFTGATITPRAIVRQLKNVLLLVQQHPELIEQAPACEAK